MADDEGLTPPPMPERKPAAAPPPDLIPGTVKQSLDLTIDASSEATKKWSKALDTAARVGGEPEFVPFKERGADVLKPVESMFEEAVGGDPSLAGMFKGVGKGILTGIGSPITAITDEYQARKIRVLQEEFMKKHDGTLRALNNHLSNAKREMRLLGNFLEKARLDPSKLDRIMNQKKEAGDRLHRQILDSLENAKSPEERQKLEAIKQDLEKWQGERDQRLKKEQPDVDLLKDRVTKMNEQIAKQADAMYTAGASEGPSTMVSADTPGKPSRVLETTHTRPDAVLHVTSLNQFLLNSRLHWDKALNP